MRVLKKNKFKTVKLHTSDGCWLVEKSFTAFSAEQQQRNTQYLYDALVWFYKEFSPIITVPKPDHVDLARSSVFMEYLEELPGAAHISSRTISKANRFFEHCYQIQDDRGFLRNLHGSVAVTPKIQALLDTNFPQSLGFRGDLRENLVIGQEGVILADIDSISLEPIGLSELALYAELSCTFAPQKVLAALFFSLPMPMVYRHMDEQQASQINEAAVELITTTMHELSPKVRTFKINRAKSVLAGLARRYYSKEG